MIEQRRNKRIPVTINLEVSEIFKQDNVRVSNLSAPIEVKDISKSGIGFVSESILPIGFYFNSQLTFEKQEKSLNCVVQIVRQIEIGEGKYNYGCEFVGMASVFDYIFEEIEKSYSEQKEQ